MNNRPQQYKQPDQPPAGTGQEERVDARASAGPAEGMPPQQTEPPKDPDSITVFRTGNFFVHAFPPLLKTTGTPHRPGEQSLLERMRWSSAEKERLMATQTHLLPRPDTLSSVQVQATAFPLRSEIVVVGLILGVTIMLQALNLFNYPAYTIDEGQYMANAWAILHGHIEPYVYTYDYPPVGWLLIAVWTQLTGGIASFGTAINSGRTLMLVLAAASSLLLYLITRSLSGSRSAALLALVIYALSPLSLLYRREVLLDNIGVCWLLLSLCLITTGKSRLPAFAGAAVALGMAILSKEIFLLFLPVLLYAVWLYATPFQRQFSLLTFLAVVLAVASAFVLLAALKGELFPPGVWPGDKGSHPSLIGALWQKWQMPGVNGQFRQSWNSWMQGDWLLLAAGTIAMFINVLGGIVNRAQLLAALLAATFMIYLLSSNVMYPFYIVPLLPFLALNIVMSLNTPLRWLTRNFGFDRARVLLCSLLIVAMIPIGLLWASPVMAKNTAEPQRQAMLWIRAHVPRNAEVIINSYMYTDLHEPGGMGVGSEKPFEHAQIYSNAALDPQISNQELKQDWQKIDYLVMDATMLSTIRPGGQYTLLDQALHHASLRTEFGSSSDGTRIQIYQVNHG